MQTGSVSTPAKAPPAVSTSEAPPSEADLAFPDATGKICLLCARQFKSPEQLGRHNNESDLHKVPLLESILVHPLKTCSVEKLRGPQLARSGACQSCRLVAKSRRLHSIHGRRDRRAQVPRPRVRAAGHAQPAGYSSSRARGRRPRCKAPVRRRPACTSVPASGPRCTGKGREQCREQAVEDDGLDGRIGVGRGWGGEGRPCVRFLA